MGWTCECLLENTTDIIGNIWRQRLVASDSNIAGGNTYKLVWCLVWKQFEIPDNHTRIFWTSWSYQFKHPHDLAKRNIFFFFFNHFPTSNKDLNQFALFNVDSVFYSASYHFLSQGTSLEKAQIRNTNHRRTTSYLGGADTGNCKPFSRTNQSDWSSKAYLFLCSEQHQKDEGRKRTFSHNWFLGLFMTIKYKTTKCKRIISRFQKITSRMNGKQQTTRTVGRVKLHTEWCFLFLLVSHLPKQKLPRM